VVKPTTKVAGMISEVLQEFSFCPVGPLIGLTSQKKKNVAEAKSCAKYSKLFHQKKI
jgi:hypothetical protein